MSQSTKETWHFPTKIGNFRQHSARIGNIRQFSSMKKRYNGMRQKKRQGNPPRQAPKRVSSFSGKKTL
nr:MAG TPA: hypothetical protein [Caudoviricetes sp.]